MTVYAGTADSTKRKEISHLMMRLVLVVILTPFLANYPEAGLLLHAGPGREPMQTGPSAPPNELILPMVANGAFAEKLHYQTIFTVLNTTGQSTTATLQVYSNAGKPTGAFCSPWRRPLPA